jgi:hypothetical protein
MSKPKSNIKMWSIKIRKEDLLKLDALKNYETQPRWVIIKKLLSGEIND